MPAARAKRCVASFVLAGVSGAIGCAVQEPARFGAWEPIAESDLSREAVAVRGFDAADYADGELFVWSASPGRGFVYDVPGNTWHETSAVNRPAALLGASAVWANGRVLLWGQANGHTSGARYDPSADAWSPMSSAGAPAPRLQHVTVWTGARMIVWGGANSLDPRGGDRVDGGLYDPTADQWAALPTENAPGPRARQSAVWTGSAMIVWGGQDAHGQPLADGASFDPATNAWTPLPKDGDVPKARFAHSAVWIGSEMFVWGGLCTLDVAAATTAPCTDGSAYDPVKQTWRSISLHDAATGRFASAAVWTGSQVVLWSGSGGSDDGYRWEPTRDAWTRMTKTRAPAPRGNAFAFWTGDRMLVWGGAEAPATGGFYRP